MRYPGQRGAHGVIPLLFAQGRKDLVQPTEVLDECQTELWLLTHTASRHLRCASTAYGHLGDGIALP